MRLQNKVALVTGAASGLGRAIAQRFAREGAKVVVADILEGEGRQAVDAIRQDGGNAAFQKLDVTNAADWEAVLAQTTAEYGAVNILVNNAGISGTAFNDVLDVSAWNLLMEVNATGAFLGTKFAVPIMRGSGGGAIVNMSSISAVIGQRDVHFAYNASKAAVRLLTKSTAVQFGRDGIRCSSIHPGLLPAMRTSVGAADPVFRAKLVERIPLGRAGFVEEVANAALFLASDEASYITGVELYVDGGYLAS